MEDFAKTTFRALGNLMTNNGMSFMWPDECRDVADGTFEMNAVEENDVQDGLVCVRGNEGDAFLLL